MKKRLVFLIFWIPVCFAALTALMALAKVGYPAEWPWWYFPVIAFSPISLSFIAEIAKVLAIDNVPPKNADGEYEIHAVQCGMKKTVKMWAWSKEAREFRKWYRNFLKKTGRKK